jgi:hypothetical protein
MRDNTPVEGASYHKFTTNNTYINRFGCETSYRTCFLLQFVVSIDNGCREKLGDLRREILHIPFRTVREELCHRAMGSPAGILHILSLEHEHKGGKPSNTEVDAEIATNLATLDLDHRRVGRDIGHVLKKIL